MAKCATCGAATPLYDSGVPICLECLEAREKKTGKIELGMQLCMSEQISQ